MLLESSCTADRCLRHIRRLDSCATATDEKSARIVRLPKLVRPIERRHIESASALRHLERSPLHGIELLAACVRESLCCTIRGSRQEASTNESKERDVFGQGPRDRAQRHTRRHTPHAGCPSRWAMVYHHVYHYVARAPAPLPSAQKREARERTASTERYGFAGVSRFLRPSPTRKTSLLWLRVASGRTTRHSA
jgi:hypothetical protein